MFVINTWIERNPGWWPEAERPALIEEAKTVARGDREQAIEFYTGEATRIRERKA